MKKIIATLLTGVMALSLLAGCAVPSTGAAAPATEPLRKSLRDRVFIAALLLYSVILYSFAFAGKALFFSIRPRPRRRSSLIFWSAAAPPS